MTIDPINRTVIKYSIKHGLLNIWAELQYLTFPHEADLFTLIMPHKQCPRSKLSKFRILPYSEWPKSLISGNLSKNDYVSATQ